MPMIATLVLKNRPYPQDQSPGKQPKTGINKQALSRNEANRQAALKRKASGFTGSICPSPVRPSSVRGPGTWTCRAGRAWRAGLWASPSAAPRCSSGPRGLGRGGGGGVGGAGRHGNCSAQVVGYGGHAKTFGDQRAKGLPPLENHKESSEGLPSIWETNWDPLGVVAFGWLVLFFLRGTAGLKRTLFRLSQRPTGTTTIGVSRGRACHPLTKRNMAKGYFLYYYTGNWDPLGDLHLGGSSLFVFPSLFLLGVNQLVGGFKGKPNGHFAGSY